MVDLSRARVAVIHDWLTGMRGGEAVLESILRVLPTAEIFTLFHLRGRVSPFIESRTIHTSFLQSIAERAADYRPLLPLFPRAARSWDLRGYDLIVSSSHCVAKGVAAAGRPHLCYCHTPMRYMWDRFDDYFPRTRPLRRMAALSVAPWLRRWDVATADEVTSFVANSHFVADRIRRFYNRDAAVIHPYVDDPFLTAPIRSERDDFHLVVSALVPYKRVELVVQEAIRSGRKIVIVGGGPLLETLRQIAPPNVTLTGSVSRESVIDHLSRARSLILPGVEDFGITPLEAMAVGTPVVALGEGGVLDSVIDGTTGIFFPEPEVSSLARALQAAEAHNWQRQLLRQHAQQFSRQRFEAEITAAVQQVSR